ncbi:hypothetical protein [Paenibacillus agricola]|uniref:Uncharacterized protein n=1 Tax=Paenibacillus agricola TaxID=2716264 RepID=A0ABX0JGD5_9BACL|nr:hypothetical protein [Paenibacillus agricola]NHN34851.1 hypothetical protein [Paenibacillus agricola]
MFPFEANIGKTVTLIQTLESMKVHRPFTRSLVVCKFITEVNRIAKGVPDALAIHSENKKINEDEIRDHSVVVITHSKYIQLCKDREKRKKYTEGRTNLIIDEELNLLSMEILNSDSIYTMEKILNEISVKFKIFDTVTQLDLGSMYKNIIADIEVEKNKYIENEMKFFLFEDKDVESRINELISLIKEARFTKNYLRHLKNRFGITTGNVHVIGKLEMLKRYYNNPKVIACNKTLHTYNDKIGYFLLDNNILLDASAKFHHMYETSNIFEVVNSERIFDHANWTINFIKQNSTGYAKHSNDYFYKDVMKLIKENTSEGDKIFLIGCDEDIDALEKDHPKELGKLDISMSNFQAMRGKNDWEDYNKCFIVHTPNISFAYYAFMYMFYTSEQLTNDDLFIQKINKGMGFTKNEDLEKLRITDIVSNIYQGLKRIGRGKQNADKKADVYIINNNDRVHKMILKQLNGVIEGDCKFESVREKKRKKREQKGYNKDKRQDKSAASLILEKIAGLNCGEYEIQALCQGLYDHKNFYRLWEKIKNDKIIIERNIDVAYRTNFGQRKRVLIIS